MRRRALAALAAGGLIATAARRPTLVPWPRPVRIAFPLALGGATAAGASLAPRLLRPTAVASVALTGAGAWWGGRFAWKRLRERLIAASRELDPALAHPPESSLVSGGLDSRVSIESLGREGARFVHTRAHPDAIRIFVGADSATTPEERVALAMAEIERTAALQRGTVVIQAPAGTGYANSTPIDAVELRTQGDCATIVIGYGLLPSFLSLRSLDVAVRTQRLLLESIRAKGGHPHLVLYGESLGAQVQQQALASGTADLDRLGVHSALWVGTPGSPAADEFRTRCADVVRVDSPRDIPVSASRPRIWFLEHDGDPVVRFRTELLFHQPEWLSGPRGRNVPDGMRWIPGITWAQVLVDTLFATDVVPGEFESLGHDYRADLGAVVTAAYGLSAADPRPEELEERLRAQERERALLIGAP